MQKLGFIIIVFFIACSTPSNYENEIEIQRVAKNAAFVNPSETPLDSTELKTFKGIYFFPIDEKYKVNATLKRFDDESLFDMPHTLNRTYKYQRFGEITFTLNEKIFTLPVYVNEELKQQKLLFFSFTDLTNGKQTYGGGRFLDIPFDGTQKEVELDFNLSYFPYCAYSHRFSCPIVPKENYIDIEVKAGERSKS
jgi:hypothetical protein